MLSNGANRIGRHWRALFVLSVATVALSFAPTSHAAQIISLGGEATELSLYKNVRDFGVLPTNTAAQNKTNLQSAIDWASPRGAGLFLEPSDEPYPMNGGLVLRANVSLVGVHGPVGRGTRHPTRQQPVGSVFRIEDQANVFITAEAATQLRGLQFWYPRQTISDASKIIAYPPTIRVSQTKPAQGVTLSCLTFFGEYMAMDFNASPAAPCEQILFEHCYGYPLSGEFIRLDHCYDIPRILHCHVNPANQRFIRGDTTRAVIDAVVARRAFSYVINHADNAQLIDVFTFGVYGGILLGPATYGQMTNFNFDCVSIGIQKRGDNATNRNWQIAQGSIIANPGASVGEIHALVIEGQGHTSLSNVEAFGGNNPALTTIGQAQDYLLARGGEKKTISLFGCRVKGYAAASPITNQAPQASIQFVACIDKNELDLRSPAIEIAAAGALWAGLKPTLPTGRPACADNRRTKRVLSAQADF